ncbi:MAG: hypothetical protein ACFFAN_09950 [Promethearchaeota archaeon]
MFENELIYFFRIFISFAGIILVHYIGGLLVLKKQVKVNYTRKMGHFTIVFVPFFVGYILPCRETPLLSIIAILFSISSLIIYIKPIRERSSFISTLFSSFDRPEDRPHTLFWVWTQICAIYLILIPMFLYFSSIEKVELLFIPMFITGFGDGLAEPIGVRFGKHKYKVYALFSKKKYVRSLEGSACVFIASLISTMICFPFFSSVQFIVALIAIPIIMTLAEAFSPHTWDNPFLYLVNGLLIVGILLI